MLKNVGMLCSGCSGGKHYDCEVEMDRESAIPEHDKRKMCVCYYTVHPYLSREQLTRPEAKIIAPAPVSAAVGTEVHTVGNPAPRLAAGIRDAA